MAMSEASRIIQALARQSYLQARGNKQKAAALMMRKLTEEQPLLRRLAETAVDEAVAEWKRGITQPKPREARKAEKATRAVQAAKDN